MSEDRPGLIEGASLGPYRIVSQIGAGGMGEVYLARDTRLDRDVAAKILPPAFASDSVRLARFEREAKILGALNHPYILSVHDYGRIGEVVFLITEFLSGETLRERLARGAMSGGECARIGIQIALGLSAAHEKGVVHRDLKPANVFLTREGHVKILDFGLARLDSHERWDSLDLSEAPTEENETRPGAVLGTAGYMSPEQVRGDSADAKSDLFALGIILYEMVTGKRPFNGRSEADVQAAILKEDPPPLSDNGNFHSPALETVVRRCLEKQPSRRPASAREVALDLEEVVSGQSGSIAPLLGRRARRLAIPAAVLLVLLCAVALVAVWRSVRAERGRLPPFQPRQVTSRSGPENEPAISPDGSAVAYSAETGRGTDIYVADVRGGTPLKLVSDGSANSHPAWFPDGSALAYTSNRNGVPSAWKVSRFGGPPTLLVEDASQPAIAPDASRIAFWRAGQEGFARICVARLDDPNQVKVLTGQDDGTWNHSNPAWSPDGSMLSYQDQNDIWIVPSKGGKARRITADDSPDYHPAWAPDGRHIYFDSWREGTTALWRIDTADGKLERVTLGTGSEQHPTISRDGSRLAYATRSEETLFLLEDRQSGARFPYKPGKQAMEPRFAPDSSAVVFTCNREGTYDVWRLHLKNGRPDGELERLTDQKGSCSHAVPSPDGKWISYHRVVENRRDLWILPAEGGIPQRLTDDPSIDILPDWAPDGKSVYFLSDRGGHLDVWSARFVEGELLDHPVQVTRAPQSIMSYCLSPRADKIAYISGVDSGREVWILDTGDGEAARCITKGADALSLSWDPLSGGIFVVGCWGGTRYALRLLSATYGRTISESEVAPSSPAVSVTGCYPSRDGRHCVLSESEAQGDVWVLQTQRGSF